jgi:hypothetical protein
MSTINNSGKTNINRGVELLLRKKGGTNQPELDSRQFSFGKMFSLFKREIHFEIELRISKKK